MVPFPSNQISRGGFADVYSGTRKKDPLATKLAFKVLHKVYAQVSECRQKFANEISIIWSFNHPNIVRAYGGWVDYDPTNEIYPTLVMELLPYCLADILWPTFPAEPLSNIIKLSIIRQLAEVLAFLHNRNPKIFHRDIKPENILLTADYTPKLCDFGIAQSIGKTFKASSSSAGVAGTAAYDVSCDLILISQLPIVTFDAFEVKMNRIKKSQKYWIKIFFANFFFFFSKFSIFQKNLKMHREHLYLFFFFFGK
jgi:serine/threonine protein kinase